MTPHRDEGQGTLIIDRRFKGVGRIKRASGVNDPRTLARMLERFTELAEDGRGRELLRAIKTLQLSPLEVYDVARTGDFSKLPTADALKPLHDQWLAWVARSQYSPDHTRNLKKELRRFERARKDLAAKDLPDVVRALRVSMAATPRSFNYARAAALAYLRAAVERSHPLYVAVWGIDPLSAKVQRHAPDLTIADVERYGHEAVEMALTGMLPKEYWGRVFATEGTALRIKGTKREGRLRRVPLIVPITGPVAARMTFRRRVRKIAGRVNDTGPYLVQPKDFRNFYAWLLEEAAIPRTRRRLYLGHGQRDTTDIYEEREVRRFLDADAKLLKACLKRLRREVKIADRKKAVGESSTVSSTVPETSPPTLSIVK